MAKNVYMLLKKIMDKLNVLLKKAFLLEQTNFKKPISCHLYPIRIKKTNLFEKLNYDHWDICSKACELGDKLKIPVYVFLKDALISK